MSEEIDAPEPVPAEPIPHDLDRAAYYILDVAGWDRERAVDLLRWLIGETSAEGECSSCGDSARCR